MKIFSCKTKEAYCVKILIELLQNNIKNCCLEIDKSGISICCMDNLKIILFSIFLESENFTVFNYKSNEKLYLGINLIHLHKMLKPIKKRDSLKFFIDKDSPQDLGINIIPKEGDRKTTSFIKIQNIQNIEIDIPKGYSKPVIVSSSEFQKICKGLSQISAVTHVSSRGSMIRFSSDMEGVMKRYTDFGEPNDSDSDNDSEYDKEDSEYSENFDTEHLVRITKLAGLSSTLHIYTKNENPLLFKSQVGTLGHINIYLKSKNLQELESRTVEDNDDN